jgi:hypothetical protein
MPPLWGWIVVMLGAVLVEIGSRSSWFSVLSWGGLVEWVWRSLVGIHVSHLSHRTQKMGHPAFAPRTAQAKNLSMSVIAIYRESFVSHLGERYIALTIPLTKHDEAEATNASMLSRDCTRSACHCGVRCD